MVADGVGRGMGEVCERSLASVSFEVYEKGYAKTARKNFLSCLREVVALELATDGREACFVHFGPCRLAGDTATKHSTHKCWSKAGSC